MKNHITPLLLLLTLLMTTVHFAQQTVSAEDIKPLIGEWTGSLTYIDYSSNKPYTMPANLVVKQGKSPNQFLVQNIYPNEPKANNKDKIKISQNGQQLNNKPVASKTLLEDGSLQITTEYEGKDNNRKAMIRSSYILGERQFIIRKEVKYEDSDQWFKRNEFSYSR